MKIGTWEQQVSEGRTLAFLSLTLALELYISESKAEQTNACKDTTTST